MGSKVSDRRCIPVIFELTIETEGLRRQKELLLAELDSQRERIRELEQQLDKRFHELRGAELRANAWKTVYDACAAKYQALELKLKAAQERLP